LTLDFFVRKRLIPRRLGKISDFKKIRMKPLPLALLATAFFLADWTPSTAQSNFPAPETVNEQGTRSLSKFELSLVGSWFGSGDAGKHAYVASAGSALFLVNESKGAMDLYGADDGTLSAKREGDEITGVVKGDFILWSNGTWWSRQPVPPPSTALMIWNDGTGTWTDLKKLTPSSMETNDFSRRDWQQKDATARSGGKLYAMEQFLPAHAPTQITYTFDKPITEFRAIARLGDGGRLGSVIFKVKTDAGEIFTSDLITHAQQNFQTIRLKFEPTRSICLITDPGENNFEDWANWIAPEIR
jgi:hypothetical protein